MEIYTDILEVREEMVIKFMLDFTSTKSQRYENKVEERELIKMNYWNFYAKKYFTRIKLCSVNIKIVPL